MGGSASAYFVNELLPRARITMFEKSSILGGRLNVTMVFGNGYETGGSIIHPANKYAVDLAQRFGKLKVNCHIIRQKVMAILFH